MVDRAAAGLTPRTSEPGAVVADAKLSELDSFAAWRFSPSCWRARSYGSFFPGAMLLLFALQAWREPPKAADSVALRLLPVMFALGLMIPHMRNARQGWQLRVNPGLGYGAAQLRFDAHRLELVSEQVHYRVGWSELEGHVETSDSILLYDKNSALILLIPKWPLRPAQLRELRRHLPGPPPPLNFWMLKVWIGLAALLSVWYVWPT